MTSPVQGSPSHHAQSVHQPGQSPADGEVHLLDRLAVVYRYRQIAAAVFILTALTVMIQGYTSVKVYQAQARLQIEPEHASALPGSMQSELVMEDPEIFFQTQFKIIKSREVGRTAASRLRLNTIPEFNGTEPPPTTPFTLLAKLRDRVTGGKAAKPEVSAPKPDEASDEAELVSGLLGRVSVEPVRGTHLVDVLFEARDPQFAADAANMVAEVYVEQNLQHRQSSTQSQIAFITAEVEKQKEKVSASQRGLGEYREKQNALSLDDRQNVVLSRLTKYNDDVMQIKSRRSQKEAAYKTLLSAGGAIDSVPAIAADPTVQSLKGSLDNLQTQRAKLLESGLLEKHP
jgi:uncharacterized protein involved in exopolysaccharide biosynthesis